MGFLKELTKNKKVCIQCHDNPDADTLASAFGVYEYLVEQGVEARIVYSGKEHMKKFSICYMVEMCHIPIRYVDELPECDLLLIVDAQYRQGNVTCFEHNNVAVIDHHYLLTPPQKNEYVKSDYQSCATVVWELLKEEGYDVKENEALTIALLFGLYTDTSTYSDLYREIDMQMKLELTGDYPVLERLTKSNMTVSELMIASEAMRNHELDIEHKFAIVEVTRCDQSILGIIGDFIIQVDSIFVSFAYTTTNEGYQISVRSCTDKIHANELAMFLCKDIGSGGGHLKKGGGRVSERRVKEKYGDRNFKEIVRELMCEFIENA